ncbi:alpha/beta fold hydrolase [Kitasatospora viridis]|uniref:Pimeloyl-ACP methyl ester carboxylesterase n=1 Tax=Kitasatospora viridis TaxID=281105 RepID=A0A561UG20_9ACTN|nr:alpha/beta hydrolase [Kitasatospora viridis]TWF98309.1 pimeloyl-ACP methyl ester carboxylesterase [Kitasatospora viridis]
MNATAWTGTLAIEDTTLAVTDTGGPGPTVVYLNGSYADQKHWQRVIAELGDDYRHITFDERARGKSGTACDYSFEACLRDLDAVLTARNVERPILVGWSYGALIAVHWAARHPERTAAVVSVDGALPTEPLDEATRTQVRALFRRLSPVFPIARRLGMAARMSATQHAEINLELIDLCAPTALAPVLDAITAPTRYVLGTGGNLGADAKTMERLRADLGPALDRNPRIEVSAKVPSNHSKILRNDHRAVATAVRELADQDLTSNHITVPGAKTPAAKDLAA